MALAARRSANTRRSKDSGGQSGNLTLPELTADMRPRIGSSQIDEFVLAHGATDILRELVQNEFDGGGSEMTMRFGQDMLTVTGSGAPIKAKGWTRLSVIMGTGEVIGDGQGETIEAKENGIGSKNFGLRSLFSYADRIHVRSDGRMGVLDVRNLVAGSQPDPGSAGLKGVLIQAPYRAQMLRQLQPFTLEREQDALDDIERAMFPTLVKLALYGAKPGLRRLQVVSERTGRTLQWRQSAEAVACSTSRVSAQVRKGRLTRRESSGPEAVQHHEEIEFSRYIELPDGYAQLDFPSYYRRGGRVKVAISLALRAGKLRLGRPGRFYYPLEAGQSRTGCAISVSGPFQLNGDRSRLNETAWNTWLQGQAADLVVDLLGGDWFSRFGAAAFEALQVFGVDDEPKSFRRLVTERLKSAACWPSATGALTTASALVAPREEALAGHIAEEAHLHPLVVANPAAQALAIACGTKPFTINSLVRLRCAGVDGSGLATKVPDGEAFYRYADFPGILARIDEQVNIARALTQLQKHLSVANWRDLAESPSTSSATGQMRPARSLVLVGPDMWEGCPIPLERRLHPDLVPYRAISSQCKPFDLRAWVSDAASRAKDGEISDPERLALYRHLIARDTKLSTQTLALVRRSPVLKTQGGAWAAADEMLWPAAKDQALLGLAIPAPSRDLRSKALLDRFRIRRGLKGADLIAVADLVGGQAQHAAAFEDLLRRNLTLLTPSTVAQLQTREVLRSRAGNLARPAALHLPTPVNIACLDAAEDLVDGDEIALFRRLGCREAPALATLLAILERRREQGEPPPHPQQFYPALVEALRAERQPLTSLMLRPILFIDGKFATPFESLINSRAPKCLWGAVTIYKSGGVVGEAYLALGGALLPRDQHWKAFLEWIDRRAPATPGAPLPRIERVLLLDAYGRLGFRVPPDLAENVKWLLGEKGDIHSLAELRSGAFLENDFVELAEALRAANAPVAFASHEQSARGLFRSLGLRALSQVCGEAKVSVGAPALAPSWFRPEKWLAILHGEDLASALYELAFAHQKQVVDFSPARALEVRRRLAAIAQIRFVQDVRRTYTHLKRVSVSAESALEGDHLAMRPPSKRWEFEHVVAGELARLAGAKRLPDVRSLVPAILPLLQAESSAERLAYLQRLGIRPPHWPGDDIPDRDEELQDLGEGLVRDLFDRAKVVAPSGPVPAPPPVRPPPSSPPPPAAPPPALPPIEKVVLKVGAPQSHAPPAPAAPVNPGWSGRSSGWTPRTPQEMARDAEVGRRGEEIVYRAELERVRAMGWPNPEHDVVWTSQTDAGADHDIRSVGEDGQPIWIEVKTTTGVDGRFDWPRREFEKALREGARYQLWRVYNGAGTHPDAKVFVDPVDLIKRSILRLEIGDLRAFVESK